MFIFKIQFQSMYTKPPTHLIHLKKKHHLMSSNLDYNLCIDLNIGTWLTILLLVFMNHGMGKTLSAMQVYTNS